MDFQRLLLFSALALVLMMIWTEWQKFKNPQENTPQETATKAPADGQASAVPTPPSGEAEQDVSNEVPAVPKSEGTVPKPAIPTPTDVGKKTQRVVVNTDLLHVEIDTIGGDIRKVSLIKHPVSVDKPDQPFELIKDDPTDLFIAQSGLIGEGRKFPTHKTVFTAPQSNYQLSESKDSIQAKLLWKSPDNVEYTKVYTFRRDSYLIDVDYQVINRSNTPWQGFIYAQFQRTAPITEEGFSFIRALPSFIGGAIYTPETHYEKISFDDMAEQDIKKRFSNGWVAMLQHYFVGAWIPKPDGVYEAYTSVYDGPRYNIGYKTMTPVSIAANSSGKISTQLYIGTKEQERLKEPAEGLVLTVDYGWLTPVSSPLYWVLNFINGYVNNWGWSIILLTVLIKLVFFPLSAASYKSMAKMKQLQPRLQTLKERYGGDKQKLNQAMMEMYKKDKINPMGGCLPILVQIPVFIALYWVLLESVELRQAPFALWLHDLSIPDPYFVLPLIMGASMFAQQFLNPAPIDPVQKKVMMALPVVFTVFFLWFPAGLVLYWVVNNILSIAQQWYITNKLQAAKTQSKSTG